MCRPKSAGGRRCPAHSTPEYRERENARRRAQYAAKKPTPGATFGIKTITTGNRTLVNTGTTITGIITTEQLTAYTPNDDLFGFLEHYQYNLKRDEEFLNSLTPEDYAYPRKLTKPEIFSHSQEVVEGLEPVERAALIAYTGSQYKKIHRYIIQKLNPKNYHLADGSQFFDENGNIPEFELLPDGPTELLPNVLKELEDSTTPEKYLNEHNRLLVQYLDKAIENGTTNEQRILYRGLPVINNIFKANDPTLAGLNVTDEQKQAYLNEHIQIGQEIVFDSYMSATQDVESAAKFSTQGCVEILTPKGVPIAALSLHPAEQEVLLPRGQRYKIVGTRVAKLPDRMTSSPIVQLVAINSKGEILDGTNDDPIVDLWGRK